MKALILACSTCLTLFTLTFSVASDAADIDSVLAHPIYGELFACTEHWQGNLKGLGDELGTDCWIQQLVEVEGRVWPRANAGNGRRNEDWYGWGKWGKSVLSPCTCEVIKINLNMTVNQPGVIGKPPASFVVLKREDGVYFMLAHVADVVPKVGEPIEAGQLLAHVGNNGYARLPHIHIGAWRGDTPLQIKFDQAAMGKLLER